MKQIVEWCQERGMLFRSLKPIAPKSLGSRKKIQIFVGVDMRSYYHALFVIEKKSRILRKEAEAFGRLHTALEQHLDTRIKHRCILVKAPLCSKAKQLLEESGWRVELGG